MKSWCGCGWRNWCRTGCGWRLSIGAGEEMVARGEQQIACMKREGEKLSPAPVPQSLREALAAYAE